MLSGILQLRAGVLMPEKSREKCAIVGCHDPMSLFYKGKPVCAKHWARDWVNGFSLDVELGFSKKEEAPCAQTSSESSG